MGADSGTWGALLPRFLLIGATSSDIHYNIYARGVAVQINCALVIPALNYCDDFGALVDESIAAAALSCVEEFCNI